MKHLLVWLLVMTAEAVVAQDQLIAVRKNSKWGYSNASGIQVIPARFDDASPFFDGRAVVTEGKTFGVIDVKGAWIIKPMPGNALGDLSSKRVVCANDKGKWGVLDLKGKQVLPFSADIVSAYQSNMAITGTATTGNPQLVQINVVDTLGKAVISFDNIYLPIDAIRSGKKVREGYVSVLVDGDYSKVLSPSEFKLGDKTLFFALLDIRNKRLVNFRISSLNEEVREGRFNQVIEGIAYSWSLPLSAEPVVSEAKFSYLSPTIFPFSGGIAAVQKEGKWAYVDKDGSLVSETNLPVADYQSDRPLYAGGFVMFRKKGGEWIYTDLTGTQRVGLEFEEANPFQMGAAVVKSKGKYGLVQKDGTWLLQPEYDAIRY